MPFSNKLKTSFKIFIFSFFALFLYSSCVQSCVEESSLFRVRIELQTELGGSMSLIFTTKESDLFSEEIIVKSIIQKSSGAQFVEFCLDKEPRDLSFTFSKSSETNKLKILSALFENKDKQLFINGEKFNLYFKRNENIKYDSTQGVYILNKHHNNVKTHLDGRSSIKRLLRNRLSL